MSIVFGSVLRSNISLNTRELLYSVIWTKLGTRQYTEANQASELVLAESLVDLQLFQVEFGAIPTGREFYIVNSLFAIAFCWWIESMSEVMPVTGRFSTFRIRYCTAHPNRKCFMGENPTFKSCLLLTSSQRTRSFYCSRMKKLNKKIGFTLCCIHVCDSKYLATNVFLLIKAARFD